MPRHWLVTWTCYGSRLPGDADGFVGNVRDKTGKHVIHNIPGTPYDEDMPALERYAREQMTGPPVHLVKRDAACLIAQYQETSRIREWNLQAASVMYNHSHVVVTVVGDPEPAWIRETLKSWATRGLKKIRPLPPSGTFWTAKGSNRKLPTEEALCEGVIYVVKRQPDPLAVWYAPEWQLLLDTYDQGNRGL